MSGFTIGIDLGGTKVSVALVDSKGKILGFQKEPTEKSSPAALAAQLARLAKFLVEESRGGKRGLKGVGLASAGPLNVTTGKLLHPSNFKGWKVVPIVNLLEKALAREGLRTRVAFQNDAMAAALGEGWTGGARGLGTFAVITLGTGIGTGIIFDGKPLQWKGMGGEFGIQLVNHLFLLKGSDPYFACVEGMASGTGILKRARESGFDGESVEELHARLETGDRKFAYLFDEAALALAMLCYNLSLGINPDKILFTGGLMHIEEYFYPKLLARYGSLIEKYPEFRTTIAKAKLGFRAGVIGAARLPWLARK